MKIKKLLLKGIAIYVGVIGFLSGIFELVLDYKLSIVQFVIISLLILVMFFLTEYFKNVNQPLSAEELFLFNISDNQKSTIVFPCQIKHLRIANKIAKKAFGKRDSISFQKVLEWWEKNPYTLSLYLDENRKVKGYFDIFPIESAFEKKLAEGVYDEDDLILGILPPKDKWKYENLYVGGIAVLNPYSFEGKKNAALLIRGMFYFIDKFFVLDKPVKLSATAVTKEGEILLQRMGFEIEVEASLRKDKNNYYSRTLVKDEISKVINDLGMLSSQLDLAPYNKFLKNG